MVLLVACSSLGRIWPQTLQNIYTWLFPLFVLPQPFIPSSCKTPTSSFRQLASSLSFVLRHTTPTQEAGLLATLRNGICIYRPTKSKSCESWLCCCLGLGSDAAHVECHWHHTIIDLSPLQRASLLVGMVILGICPPRPTARSTIHPSP